MHIKRLAQDDIPKIVTAFDVSGWTQKPATLFQRYLQEQRQDKRVCFVAQVQENIAGYVTLFWHSTYPPFAREGIPEIMDLNVLPAFRNQGVGSALLETCERLAAQASDKVGIGVGLYPDYGSAQRLYVKRGYLPDGSGATYGGVSVTPGKTYAVDDELIVWSVKSLKNPSTRLFDHVQLKVKNLRRSRPFYDAIMDALGHRVVLEIQDSVVGYGTSVHDMFELRQMDDNAPLSQHVHLAFQVASFEKVDKFYHVALEKGGICNGKPGFRPEYEGGYYAAFITDINGHNLEAVYTSMYL